MTQDPERESEKVEPERPRVIEETLVRSWRAVTGPVDCQCGHVHYGRVYAFGMAPQYGFCEHESCEPHALQRVDPARRIGEVLGW